MTNHKFKQGFAQHFIAREGGEIRLVLAQEEDCDAWFLIKINPHLFTQYKAALNLPEMNIKDFGEVLQSGWGEPPANLLAEYTS